MFSGVVALPHLVLRLFYMIVMLCMHRQKPHTGQSLLQIIIIMMKCNTGQMAGIIAPDSAYFIVKYLLDYQILLSSLLELFLLGIQLGTECH